MSDIPDDIQITAQQLVDATFHAEIDRWDGNPDLPHILVSYVARAILAERAAERERCAQIADDCAATAERFEREHLDRPSLDFQRYRDGCNGVAAAIRAGEDDGRE